MSPKCTADDGVEMRMRMSRVTDNFRAEAVEMTLVLQWW
jgi:hypothetical protein